MSKNINFIGLIAALSLCISACSQPSTEEYLAEADKSLEKGDRQSAIVNLKNAAQEDPATTLVRFKLGKLYLDMGSPAPAEKELKLALKGGYEANSVLPLIAKSLILQFKNQELLELVDQSRNLSLESSTTLYALQAQAYFQLGDTAAAAEAINNANELSAESPYAQLGQAYAAFNKEQIDLALETVNMLLAKQPEFSEALLLKGQLENSVGNFKTALDSFEKYHQLLPELLQGKIYLIDSYIKNHQLDKAEAYTDKLLVLYKNSPYINQLKSQIKFELKNYNDAKLYAETAINNGGQNQTTSTIAAISAYQLGLNEQAYRHFLAIIDSLPSNSQLRGLYEVLEISLGYKVDGLADSDAINELSGENAGLIIHSGMKLIAEGKYKQAKQFIDVIDSKEVTDPIELTRLGMAKLSLNDKSAFDDLERVLQTSPENIEVKNILARAYTAEGNFQKALDIANSIISNSPNKVEGYNLAGYILASSGKIEEAQKQHLKALEIDANDITSTVFFGKLAISKKDYSGALDTYRHIMSFKPLYLPALVTYFELEHNVGVPEKAITPIEQAYAAEPKNTQYALFFAKFLSVEKNYQDALTVLESIPVSDQLPENYWDLIVETYIKLNRNEEIEKKLIEWTSNKPSSGLGWASLANFYENKNEIRKALQSVTSGLKNAENNIDNLKVLQAQYLIYLNRIAEAQNSVSDLLKIYEAKNPVIELLNGQILIIQNNFKDALPKLKVNYEYKPTTRVLKLILNCYVKLGQKNNAIQFAKEHLAKFSEDNQAMLYLANLVMDTDRNYSEQLYHKVLKTDSLNPIALNNLAAIMQQNGRHKEAADFVRKALDQSPEEPYLLEIYASALLKAKDVDGALIYYAKAYEISGKSAKFAKPYIAALSASGNSIMAQKISDDAHLD